MIARLRTAAQLVAVALVGLVVPLAMAEVAVRWLAPQPLQHIRLDDELYFVNQPRARFVYARDDEYSVPIAYNDWGFRGRIPEPHAPPGVTRILVLGASQTEGLQVNDDELFSSVLAPELEQLVPGRRFEVVNLGVSAYGTHQMVLTLRRYAARVNPDWVVLGFSPSFEIEDNARIPLAMIDEGGGVRLVPHQFARGHRLFLGTKVWLGGTSQLYILATSRIKALFHASLARRGVLDAAGPATPGGSDETAALFRAAPFPPRVARDIALTEGLIDMMRTDACRLGAGFAVVTVPAKFQVDRRLASPAFTDLDRPEREFAGRFEHDRILHVDTLPALRTARDGGVRTYFIRDGHLNAAGHRVVGHAVAGWLADHVKDRTKSAGAAVGCRG